MVSPSLRHHGKPTPAPTPIIGSPQPLYHITTDEDSMPDSLPGNGPYTLFLIMIRVMHLFPLLRSRQCPVVEPEPLIREALQKFHVGAGPLEILAECCGKFAPHICIKYDRFGKRLSEGRLVKRRDLPSNRGDRGVGRTHMIEHIVTPCLCANVEQTRKTPTHIFRRPEDNGVQCAGVCAGYDTDLRHHILIPHPARALKKKQKQPGGAGKRS